MQLVSHNSLQVSVIVPSYNRAHLLPRTLPSYLNNQVVQELIVVDDASTDNTETVVKQLQNEYPQIKYIKLASNSKQPYAKNVGMEAATCPYLYFGDDDSFMLEGAIDELVNSLHSYHADIVGARALYLKEEDDLHDLTQTLVKYDQLTGTVCDLKRLAFNFYLNPQKIIPVPVCHACFLISRGLARQIKFDPNYKGNCFREETDFLLRARGAGAQIYFNPFVTQFNLPRSQATSGAHSMSMLNYRLNCLANNWYFLHKNQTILNRLLKQPVNIYYLQGLYVLESLYHLAAGLTPSFIKKLIKKFI
jgi:glycosyltransferase involved in cell wall biosynthesis